MRNEDSLTKNIDWVVLSIVLLMMLMGLANIYSAAFNPKNPSLFDFAMPYGKQIMWICIALFLGLLVFLIDGNIYYKFAVPIYLVCLGLLGIVLFMPPINGARAWLGFGGFGIQPAEFAKIGTAIVLSRYIGDFNMRQQNIGTVLISLGLLLVPMGLIILQPDAGTFVVFTSFLFVMYREGITFDPLVLKIANSIPGIRYKETWVGAHFIPIIFVLVFLVLITLLVSNNLITFDFLPGVTISGFWGVVVTFIFVFLLSIILVFRFTTRRYRGSYIGGLLLAFVIGMLLIFSVNFLFQNLASHQKIRIELFLGLKEDNNGEDYNRFRAMAAVGSGGMFGKGYQNASMSSVQSNHVPESETDFIFCPLAEEWGFAGAFTVMSMFLILIFRCISIAERQRSNFNRIYAYCVAMILFYHLAINVGMDIGFAPVIGIPLPFFSYGGSGMMSFSMMMFILLKLDSQRRDML